MNFVKKIWFFLLLFMFSFLSVFAADENSLTWKALVDEINSTDYSEWEINIQFKECFWYWSWEILTLTLSWDLPDGVIFDGGNGSLIWGAKNIFKDTETFDFVVTAK